MSEQRATQNAADAAARAGALVLGKKMTDRSGTTTDAEWDEQVRHEVAKSALANHSTILEREYTDWQANPLGANVGGSVVPPTAAGVRIVAQKQVRTYLISAVGFTNWTINQTATAVTGPSAGCIETQTCQMLPITFPINVYICSGNNKTEPIYPPQSWVADQEITLPICGGNPGSVGWLDWTPTEGGTSEIVDVVREPAGRGHPLAVLAVHHRDGRRIGSPARERTERLRRHGRPGSDIRQHVRRHARK